MQVKYKLIDSYNLIVFMLVKRSTFWIKWGFKIKVYITYLNIYLYLYTGI